MNILDVNYVGAKVEIQTSTANCQMRNPSQVTFEGSKMTFINALTRPIDIKDLQQLVVAVFEHDDLATCIFMITAGLDVSVHMKIHLVQSEEIKFETNGLHLSR